MARENNEMFLFINQQEIVNLFDASKVSCLS